MFILGTIFIGANTKVNELSFIDNRNFPGGPNAYLAAFYNSTPNLIGNTMFILADWLADGLLVRLVTLLLDLDINHPRGVPVSPHLQLPILDRDFACPFIPRVYRYVLLAVFHSK